MLNKLHWLPVEHHSVFKTSTLVHKFLHTGFPKYFVPFTSSYSTSYSTKRNQSGSNFFLVPKFQRFIQKSVKQFGYSFAFDAPTVWNYLPDEMCASPALASFNKAVQKLPFHQGMPTLGSLICWHSLWCLTFFLSLATAIG